MENKNLKTISISKNKLMSETEFKNSNAFFFLMTSISQNEKRNLQNSEVYQNAIKILQSINIGGVISDDGCHVFTSSINLQEYSSREVQVAGQAVLLYLSDKKSQTKNNFIKSIYSSSIKSLTGKNSEEIIEKEGFEEIVDTIDLLNDKETGKIVQ